MSAFTTISDGDEWKDTASYNNLPNLKGPSKTVVEYRDHEKGGFAYRVCQLSYLDLYVE